MSPSDPLSFLLPKNSAISGTGIFTQVDIEKGELITVMEGQPMSSDEVIQLVEDGVVAIDDPLQIQEWEYLLLSPFHRLFNHSCEPNAGINGERYLIALRDIQSGEEITYDYSSTTGTNILPESWSMECHCGHSLCRKTIGNVTTLTQSTIQYYENQGVLPDFIQRQLSKLDEE